MTFTLTTTIEHDSDHGAPWDNCEGHGIISEWTTRDKLPGELILASDGNSKRYYDYAETCKIARRDGWGFAPWPYVPSEHCHVATAATQQEAISALYAAHGASMSPRAYAALATMSDYNRLKAWCDDQWQYVGVIVTASKAGIELGNASLWGIESDWGDYLEEVTESLAEEAIADAMATLATLTE